MIELKSPNHYYLWPSSLFVCQAIGLKPIFSRLLHSVLTERFPLHGFASRCKKVAPSPSEYRHVVNVVRWSGHFVFYELRRTIVCHVSFRTMSKGSPWCKVAARFYCISIRSSFGTEVSPCQCAVESGFPVAFVLSGARGLLWVNTNLAHVCGYCSISPR